MLTFTPVRFDFRALGGACSVQLDGPDERLLRRVAWLAIAEIQRIELKYSRYQANSVISRINARAGGPAEAVDAETLALLAFAHGLWQQSDGLFDATTGVLRRAWDFELARLPERQAVARLLPLIGWDRVEIHDDRVRLPQPGMELDFGGFIKAYAADSAAGVLLEHGVHHALVQVGGSLNAVGPRGLPGCAHSAWQVPVPQTRPLADSADRPLTTLSLHRGGLATSGRFESGFALSGRHYGPLLDPRTGWPVQPVAQVTVAATRATAAAAMAAIGRLQGEQAMDWLDEQETPYLLVDADAVAHHNTRRSAPYPIFSTTLKGVSP